MTVPGVWSVIQPCLVSDFFLGIVPWAVAVGIVTFVFTLIRRWLNNV